MPRRTTSIASSRPTRASSPRAEAGLIRIQKVLAEAGIYSRRQCEQLVAEGRVTVNGRQVREIPCFVNPETDRIAVDGKAIAVVHPSTRSRNQLHLLFHKPPDILCEADTILNRRSILDVIDMGATIARRRLHCACPMPHEYSGLILITTDSTLAERLTHARYGISKTWEVKVKGIVTSSDLAALTTGLKRLIHLRKQGGNTGQRSNSSRRRSSAPATQAARERPGSQVEEVALRIEHMMDAATVLLCETAVPMDEQVAMLFKSASHPIRHMRRLAIGPLTLKGLAVGNGRTLSSREVRQLRAMAFTEQPGE